MRAGTGCLADLFCRAGGFSAVNVHLVGWEEGVVVAAEEEVEVVEFSIPVWRQVSIQLN